MKKRFCGNCGKVRKVSGAKCSVCKGYWSNTLFGIPFTFFIGIIFVLLISGCVTPADISTNTRVRLIVTLYDQTSETVPANGFITTYAGNRHFSDSNKIDIRVDATQSDYVIVQKPGLEPRYHRIDSTTIPSYGVISPSIGTRTFDYNRCVPWDWKVCTLDGNTYQSQCEAVNAGQEMLFFGECSNPQWYVFNQPAPTPTPVPAPLPAPVCGDGFCDSPELPHTCPADCLTHFCGDNTCDSDEDYQSCPGDCIAPHYCGDGTCDTDEDLPSCPADCLIPEPEPQPKPQPQPEPQPNFIMTIQQVIDNFTAWLASLFS